eukprot:Filipodium_phascolosomae@DN6035_c0_g1_i1.p1
MSIQKVHSKCPFEMSIQKVHSKCPFEIFDSLSSVGTAQHSFFLSSYIITNIHLAQNPFPNFSYRCFFQIYCSSGGISRMRQVSSTEIVATRSGHWRLFKRFSTSTSAAQCSAGDQARE